MIALIKEILHNIKLINVYILKGDRKMKIKKVLLVLLLSIIKILMLNLFYTSIKIANYLFYIFVNYVLTLLQIYYMV